MTSNTFVFGDMTCRCLHTAVIYNDSSIISWHNVTVTRALDGPTGYGAAMVGCDLYRKVIAR